MKTLILLSAFLACSLSAPIVLAQEKAAPAKPPMSMDKQMPQMQEDMEKMQQQMEKLRATTDPAERQKLMQEHMQSMQDNMKAMHGMGGPMMGGNQHGGMAAGSHKDMGAGDTMNKRMDMMQMMMEQMVQHQQMQESTPK